MTSPSKAKGSSFEREIANFLSKTYDESFIRAPGSGAYIGGKNQSRKQYLDGKFVTSKEILFLENLLLDLTRNANPMQTFPFIFY